MKTFYNLIYRYARAPWEGGPREELVRLVESGAVPCGTAVDLGCGTGANAIYLAQHGFEVTGVDFSEAAVEKARKKADHARVRIQFIVDDLTDLKQIHGAFDFLLDYGVFDDLRLDQRERYVQSTVSLSRPGSQYLLWGFEYPMRWWEKWIPFMDIPFVKGEIERRFGKYFEIEKIGGDVDWKQFPPGWAAYLMRRM
jgi:SAM-dependent methyltransferase